MIQANELRLGNYLLHNGKIVIVDEILFNGINLTHEGEEYKYKDLKPIELTEEILLKCGFEKYGDFWYVLGDIKIEVTTRGYFRFSGYVRIYQKI